MELGLKEIGITFLVGAFVVLGVDAIASYIWKRSLTGFFEGRVGFRRRAEGPEPLDATVFILIAFVAGIVAEDVSYKFADASESPLSGPAAWIAGLPSVTSQRRLGLDHVGKDDVRLAELVSCLNESGGHREPLVWTAKAGNCPLEATPLAKELAERRLFSGLLGERGKAVEDWFLKSAGGSLTPLDDARETRRAIVQFFYHAKNIAYTHPTYFSEMTRIQTRVDFSRSISLISLILCGAVLVSCLAKSLYKLIRFQHLPKGLLRPTLRLGLALFSIYFAATWAYTRESDEFNKRAFGYYSSLMADTGHANAVGGAPCSVLPACGP